VPDPVVTRDDGAGPEGEAVVADAVGVALLVVLERLTPAERLAFVLHDLFAVPFDEIAPIVDRSPEAARQLASRARRRVQTGGVAPDPDLGRQRAVVDAFFAAARGGDLEALVAVLDPEVVVRSDGGVLRREATGVEHGALAVASRAITYAHPSRTVQPVLVNGAAGVLVRIDGELFSVMGFTVAGGHVVAIDVLVDPERLARLDLSGLDAP
jgi:RNA polymerase sigma-70 factor (ECF subfamily)